jgi:hypothetical protein
VKVQPTFFLLFFFIHFIINSLSIHFQILLYYIIILLKKTHYKKKNILLCTLRFQHSNSSFFFYSTSKVSSRVLRIALITWSIPTFRPVGNVHIHPCCFSLSYMQEAASSVLWGTNHHDQINHLITSYNRTISTGL